MLEMIFFALLFSLVSAPHCAFMCGTLSASQKAWVSLPDFGRLIGYYLWFVFGLAVFQFFSAGVLQILCSVLLGCYLCLQLKWHAADCCLQKGSAQGLLQGLLPTLALCPSILFLLAISSRPFSSGNILMPLFIWLMTLPSLHFGRWIQLQFGRIIPQLRYLSFAILLAFAFHHLLLPHAGSEMLSYLSKSAEQIKSFCGN